MRALICTIVEPLLAQDLTWLRGQPGANGTKDGPVWISQAAFCQFRRDCEKYTLDVRQSLTVGSLRFRYLCLPLMSVCDRGRALRAVTERCMSTCVLVLYTMPVFHGRILRRALGRPGQGSRASPRPTADYPLQAPISAQFPLI
jgi:hypothetical protein